MGLPIEQLIIATNRNDVLHRIMTTKTYARTELHHTLSPSMDITVSSNFERLLFDLYDRDGPAVAELLQRFDTEDIVLSDAAIARARSLFDSQCVSDEETCQVIAEVFGSSEYLLDPHTAIGVRAARDLHRNPATPIITLATAHPAKFPDAIARAGVDFVPALPHHMIDLFDRPERFEVLPNDLAQVQAFMTNNINA
jgi:threonine synthase